MLRLVGHGALILFLTILTQLGGLAWLAALAFRRRVLCALLFYAGLSLAALVVAPMFGRVPLPCLGDGAMRMHAAFYCVTNRHYAAPELAALLQSAAEKTQADFPGTQTRILDANFPFITGFPLLPHLSHDDGEKADLAFFYRAEGRYRRGLTPSPIGYFAFEDGPTQCPRQWLSMRWSFSALQPHLPHHLMDMPRTRSVVQHLAQDARTGKIFLEPHLKVRLGLTSDKIRFQGCRAARHDDHIHVQL